MGCVLPAGLGQAPARQAALGAGIPDGRPTTTINKMCGSGMKAIMMAADQIRAGDVALAVAGGLESMSNAPYLLPKARAGLRMGNAELLDHMFYDGLQSPFDGQLMGCSPRTPRRNIVLARRPGRVRDRIDAARPAGREMRRIRRRDHAGDHQRPQG